MFECYRNYCEEISRKFTCGNKVAADEVLIASTGVIGRQYPMERIMPFVDKLGHKFGPADFVAAARGIMTTDAVAKYASIRVGEATLVGIAKGVTKSVVNSPLVKTAVHGADPNWGRVAMAIGKCKQDTDIDPANTRIEFAAMEVYPRQLGDAELAALKETLKSDAVTIRIDLGIADGQSTVWGCDLSAGYVKINGEYTT
ncbi:MAG: bifunctional ornithine acetyltransferase/N-acetylglutamate synthase [Duganella sp.]